MFLVEKNPDPCDQQDDIFESEMNTPSLYRNNTGNIQLNITELGRC